MTDVIGPILLERCCDGGKGDMSPEEWAKCLAARMLEGAPIQGCGTWFQWYWGSNCHCPTCGRAWVVTLEHLQRYRANTPAPRLDEREIVERVTREVLARIGRY